MEEIVGYKASLFTERERSNYHETENHLIEKANKGNMLYYNQLLFFWSEKRKVFMQRACA